MRPAAATSRSVVRSCTVILPLWRRVRRREPSLVGRRVRWLYEGRHSPDRFPRRKARRNRAKPRWMFVAYVATPSLPGAGAPRTVTSQLAGLRSQVKEIEGRQLVVEPHLGQEDIED